MALWHDPLDELIADLERTLPTSPREEGRPFPTFEEHMMELHAFFLGRKDAWAGTLADPLTSARAKIAEAGKAQDRYRQARSPAPRCLCGEDH